MEEEDRNNSEPVVLNNVPESPKPLAFTIDFGSDKKIDTLRHKNLAEKFQKRHKRGESLSKLDDNNTPTINKPHLPLTGHLPRKSSFQSEGYFSSDEKLERAKSGTSKKRADLTLLLKNVTTDRMTQSFPNSILPSISSPDECMIKDVSSPELDLISPFTPKDNSSPVKFIKPDLLSSKPVDSSPECEFDKKSDTASDTGTYTLEVDNYSEEQKARMSIDRQFKIEEISVQRKTEEYVQSLATVNEDSSPNVLLSPIQNISIINSAIEITSKHNLDQSFTKSVNNADQTIVIESESSDQGNVISVTSSGAFRFRNEEMRRLEKRLSLSKSEVHVDAYIDGRSFSDTHQKVQRPSIVKRLTTTIVNVQNIEVPERPPSGCGGKVSPTKIPSPIHTMSRPRSGTSEFFDQNNTELILRPTQNYINTLQQKLSLENDDSDFDAKYGLQLNNTAHLLKQRASHTRHNSLDDRTMNNKLEHFQNKNLLSNIDQTYTNLLNQYSQQNRVIQKIHNSPNDSPIRRSSSFTNKNPIKNTNVVGNKTSSSNLSCNSPNIHRSSSTAAIRPRRPSIGEHRKIDRSQFGDTESSSGSEEFEKNLLKRKDLGNISNTRCNRAFSLRRARADSEISAPPKCPNTPEMRRKTFHTDTKPPHPHQERAISMDRKPMKTNETQSRYMMSSAKKSVNNSVKDAVKNVAKSGASNISGAMLGGKLLTNKPQAFARTDSGRFSMRSTTTSSKPPLNNATKSGKKDTGKNKQSGRSNSSLSSREVEFQNWKRRKSYDPMKAAAEGKRKEIQKRQSLGTQHPSAGNMTQSAYVASSNLSPDSSPSHSSSVHRSQVLNNMVSGDYYDF